VTARKTASLRRCAGPADFAAISGFLYTLYQPDNADGNWLQPVWEYAYTHAWYDAESVSRIGIWEAAGAIVGVATYESQLGEAFFQVHPDYIHLKPEMLTYAEGQLTRIDDAGNRTLRVYVNDFDTAFERVVRERGYEPDPDRNRPLSQFVIPDPFPPIRVPDGFHLKSLADDNDLARLDRALWRGFDHPGEPPAGGIEGRRRMQSGPHFRADLTMVIEAPSGDLVAFGGLWFDPINRLGYVEPVAVDPDYRRRRLGTAVVLEGVRRCGELGATVAYVGSDQPFYRALGFRTLYSSCCWVRHVPAAWSTVLSHGPAIS
jgi:GNAT superfamily N-acetyltransferase